MSYFDDHFDGIFEEDPFDHGPLPVTCNRCGKKGLEWFDTGIRWVLLEKNKPHICEHLKPSADDFEDIS